jgi:hypothetical protein
LGNAPFLSTYSYIWSLILYLLLFLKTTWSVCFFQFQDLLASNADVYFCFKSHLKKELLEKTPK